jgi:hypothetical protein
VKEERSEQQEGAIRGKNAESASLIEAAPCSLLSPAIHENRRNQEPRKDEEDVHSGPQVGNAKGVVDEDGEECDGSQSIQSQDARHSEYLLSRMVRYHFF